MPPASPVAVTAIDALLRGLAATAERGPGGTRGSATSAQAGAAAAMPAAPAAAGPDAGTAVHITAVGRLVAALDVAPIALRIAGTGPLADAPGEVAALAAGLRAALADGAPARGTEPQVQVQSAQETHHAPAPARAGRDETASVADQHPPAALRAHENADTAASEDAPTAAPGRSGADDAAPGIAARDTGAAAALVRFAWEGEAWPGQRAALTVERESDAPTGDELVPVWRTTVVADLPRLGRVHAQLSVSGPRVTVALTAPNADTRARLGSERGALLAAFARAGLAAGRIEVAA